MKAILPALVVFLASFVGLYLLEVIYHRIVKNHDKNYRRGVWLFSILLAVYAFLTSLGR